MQNNIPFKKVTPNTPQKPPQKKRRAKKRGPQPYIIPSTKRFRSVWTSWFCGNVILEEDGENDAGKQVETYLAPLPSSVLR